MNVDQLVWATRELAFRKGPVERLFGAYEQLQVPLAEARATLGLPGLSVEAATNFRDKARMKTLLRANGVPCARHRLAKSVDDAVAFAKVAGFPVVVKPPAGAGAQQTFRVENLDQMSRALAMQVPSPASPVLLEEFVRGEEHSFETISIDGHAIWHSLTHYYPTPLHVLENPWIQWCLVLPREVDSPRYDDIRQAGRRALEVLGMTTGLTHMEWFRRVDGKHRDFRGGGASTGCADHDVDVTSARHGPRAGVGAGDDLRRVRPAGTSLCGRRGISRGQGQGRVNAIHGWELVQRELRELITDVKLPEHGSASSSSYEGEGFVIVRHPETSVVEQAVARIVELMRIELA
jgi:hypothetical protein